MSDDAARLARVYGYPYPAPSPPPPARAAPAAIPEGHAAILAFGANASAAVLARKLGAEVVALAAEVHGADTVYSAHVSPYGAIPATLHPSPGTSLAARVLLLAAELVPRLDATEPNYTREALAPGIAVVAEGLGPVTATAYRSRHGPLVLDGGPVALHAVPARGRTLPARGQRDVHAAIRDRLEPGADLDAFVLAGVLDADVRGRRTAILRGWGEPARGAPGRG